MENSIPINPLKDEPGHCVVDIMHWGSPVHLASRAVTWDGSYNGTSIRASCSLCGSAVTPMLKDVLFLHFSLSLSLYIYIYIYIWYIEPLSISLPSPEDKEIEQKIGELWERKACTGIGWWACCMCYVFYRATCIQTSVFSPGILTCRLTCLPFIALTLL